MLDRTRTSVLGQGTFLTLDNQIDPTTGTIRAKARFANEDIALFPSQFVNVQLQVDVIHDAVTVPAAAIRHGPSGDYVYVVDPEQVATMRARDGRPGIGRGAYPSRTASTRASAS